MFMLVALGLVKSGMCICLSGGLRKMRGYGSTWEIWSLGIYESVIVFLGFISK